MILKIHPNNLDGTKETDKAENEIKYRFGLYLIFSIMKMFELSKK